MKKKTLFEFTGCLNLSPEIPQGIIAIDNFQLFTLHNSNNATPFKYYFLSHCHSDHYKGLHENFFPSTTSVSSISIEESISSNDNASNVLSDNNSLIVCHSITKTLLLAKFPKLCSERIMTIEIGQPTLFYYKYNNNSINNKNSSGHFNVIALNANHCPGSVMFLFEIVKKNSEMETILYTGDFRNPPKETINFLQNRKLSKIYLDDTFCEHIYDKLPTRNNSIKNLIEFIEKERKKKKRIVYLTLDILGTERILLDIVKHFKTKIYLDKTNLTVNRIKELENMKTLYSKVFTLDKNSTFLRIVQRETLKTLATQSVVETENNTPLFIQVSTMWFKFFNKETCGVNGTTQSLMNVPKLKDGVWRILFSCHSSLLELKQFISDICFKQSKNPPLIMSLNPQTKNKELFTQLSKCVSTKIPKLVLEMEDDYDYSFIETNDLLFDEFIDFESDVNNNNKTETKKEKNVKQQDDLDVEDLFSLMSQEEEKTPINCSASLTFSFNSPQYLTPQSERKRKGLGEKDESFNMLNLSEDDKTPKGDRELKKVKM
ncbi:hypothetical protein ABK040_016131 [Willaertia magna]